MLMLRISDQTTGAGPIIRNRLLRISFLNDGFLTGVLILITLLITGRSVNVWQMTSQFSYYRSFLLSVRRP